MRDPHRIRVVAGCRMPGEVARRDARLFTNFVYQVAHPLGIGAFEVGAVNITAFIAGQMLGKFIGKERKEDSLGGGLQASGAISVHGGDRS